jgi:uncharacterized protein YjbI with pentapeptide repeats
MLALITVVFTWQQNNRQNELEAQRARQAQNIENQRAKAERELAKQRALDEELRAYLDQMSHLLLEKDLRGSKEDSVVRTLARARTAAVIQRLDGTRNRNVTRFLNEAQLIGEGESSIHLLAEADLEGAGLHNVDLSSADLSEANLDGANLHWTNLHEANLNWAILVDATLSGTELGHATLIKADLTKADLSDAVLAEADLSGAFLDKADLSDAYLGGADLSNADLRHANLRGAEGITNEELDQQAASLEGATMPNGQKYEDWLQSKGRKENGKSSGSP